MEPAELGGRTDCPTAIPPAEPEAELTAVLVLVLSRDGVGVRGVDDVPALPPPPQPPALIEAPAEEEEGAG